MLKHVKKVKTLFESPECEHLEMRAHVVNAFSPQVTIHVWRFCWNKKFFTRLKAILSAPSTVLCKILSFFPVMINICEDRTSNR